MNEDHNHNGRDVPIQVNLNLQDLIRERKAERRLKAEDRRQADLHRIRDMRSTTGTDPLQRFPKEIWVKILDELDPEDRGKLWELHPVFRDLMEASLIRDILFPQLLKVDTFHRCISSKLNAELRLISKSLRKSFDHYMDDRIIKRVQEMETNSPGAPFRYMKNFCLKGNNVVDGPEALIGLLESFSKGENPAKRFFTRGIAISFTTSDRTEMDFYEGLDEEDDDRRQRIKASRSQFFDSITALLEVIGHQIWHFQIFLIQLESIPYSFSEVYIPVQRWITLMPNLKWLEICIDNSAETIKPENKKSIASDLIQKNPLPHLEFLERITLHFRSRPAQMEIYEALIAANPHIKILDFTDGDDSRLQVLPTHRIQSLKQVTSISFTNDDCAGLNLSNLIESIFNFNWPLRQITLDLDMGITKLESVFRFLEKFPTLVKMVLNDLQNLLLGCSDDDDNFGYLKLPNLMHFTVALSYPAIEYQNEDHNHNNVQLFFSLQFLQHCKNLKTLYWFLRGIDDDKLRGHLKAQERHGETMDFRAGLRYMYESIIWNVFPQMETITVVVEDAKWGKIFNTRCSHVYRRRAYRERMPVTQFLRSHCCSRKRKLQGCVALLE